MVDFRWKTFAAEGVVSIFMIDVLRWAAFVNMQILMAATSYSLKLATMEIVRVLCDIRTVFVPVACTFKVLGYFTPPKARLMKLKLEVSGRVL